MHKSTKWLISEIVVIAFVITLFNIIGFPAFLPYPWHKFLHILGAILFVGNIVVTAVWMTFVAQNKNKQTLYFATQMVNWADVFFTAPGILLTLLNGQIMATAVWGGLTESWILTFSPSVLLFISNIRYK